MTADDAATWQVWISFSGLLFVIATVFYARKAWQEAQCTNKQTRDQFAAERRAWCSVEMPGPLVSIANDAVEGTADIVVKNVGFSPAQRVEYFTHSWTMGVDEEGLTRAIERARTEPPMIGMTLFPGQERKYTVNWRFDGTALSLGRKHVFLQAWVSYWVAGSFRRHFTPLIIKYECEMLGPRQLGTPVATPIRIGLPAD